VCIGLLIVFLAATANPLQAEAVDIRILFASNIPEISIQKEDKRLARLATALSYERSQTSSTVFLFGGDSLGPSLLGSFDQGSHIIDLLNALKPDSMALASHELVYGWDTLVQRIKEAKFPILSANLTEAKTGKPTTGTLPYKVIKLGKLTLGFTSVISEDALTDFLVPEAQIADRGEAIKSTLKAMQVGGADITVLMLDADLPDLDRIRKEQHIDIVLIADPEVTAVRSDSQGIVANQGGMRHLIAIDIQVADDATAWSATSRIVPIGHLAADPTLLGMANGLRSQIAEVLNKEIGKTASPTLDTTRQAVRTGENAFGNFVADALRATMGADVGLFNGGAIRGDRIYEPGTILTRRDLLTELPYTSYPILIEVTGRQLREAVENGLSRIKDVKGRFPHISNIKVAYDPNQPPGKRILEIMAAGRGVDPDAAYRLATIDYLANGGDGYEMFKDAKRLTPPDRSKILWHLVAEAVASAGEIPSRLEGRLAVRHAPKAVALLPSEKIQYSVEELAWIAQNPSITVAATPDWPPFEYVKEDGTYKGITADLLRLAASRAGLKLKIVSEPWSRLLQKLKAGEIDVAPGLPKTPERDTFLDFTKPVFEFPHAIIARKTRDDISFFDTLIDKVVAVEDGYYLQEFYEKNHPNLKVLVVPTTLEALKAVSDGRADAYIGANVVASHLIEMNFLVDLKIASYLQGKPMRLSMGVPKSRKHLRNIFQKAIDTITVQERREIVDRYVRLGIQAEKSDIPDVPLTDEEKAWLAEHKKIRLGVDPAYPPFDFIDENGRHAGMAADYMALIADRLGIDMETVPDLSWPQVLEGAKKKEIDVLPAAGDSQDRRIYLEFTRPYIKLPIIIMGRNDHKAISGLSDLKGQTVALVKGYYYVDEITREHGEIKQYLVETPLEGLRAVSLGKVDAMVVNLGVGSYLAQTETLTNLKIIGDAGLKTGSLSIGVRKDWPEFVAILEKALASLTQEEQQKIRNKWIGISADGTSVSRKKIALTPGESAWLKKHKIIRVSGDSDYPPFEFFDGGGVYRGIAADYLDLIGKRVGLEFKMIPGLAWKQVVENLENRSLDMAPVMTPTKDRKGFLFFSQPYLSYPQVLVTRKDYPAIVGMGDFKGKIVAVTKGYSEVENIRRMYPKMDMLTVDGPLDELKAVSEGRADVSSGNLAIISYLLQKHHLPNLKIAGLSDVEGGGLSIGVRKDWPELVGIIDKVLDTITPKEQQDIRTKWGVADPGEQETTVTIDLTPGERQWLREHEPLRLGTDPDWPPIDFVGPDKTYQGIASDYLRLAAQRLGVAVELVGKTGWTDTIDKMKARKIDILSTISETPERAEYMNFTAPFIKFPIIILTRDDAPFIGGINELAGRKVAVVKEYRAHVKVRDNHPDIELEVVDSMTKGIQEVSSGKTFAFVGNLATSAFILKKEGITNLKVAAPTPYAYNQAIGIRKDWPQLAPILDKALASITEQERNRIYNKWISLRFEHTVDYTLIWKTVLVIILVAGSILTVIVIWNRRLAREIIHRKKIEADLEKSKQDLEGQKALQQEILDNMDQAVVLFDADRRLVTWNKHYPDTVMLEEGKSLYKGRKVLDMAIEMAERGSYGPGEAAQVAAERLDKLWEGVTGTDVSFGDDRRYDARSTPLPDGGVVTSYTDITERLKAQRERDEAFEVITSSIRYASRIQRSVLPPAELIEEILDDHFILWKPRDVVGGDIFWCKKWGSGTVLSLADCTGHGVPGAFITLISSGALERAMLEVPEGDPAALITRMHQMIQVVLGQDTASGEADDGLELGICYIHPDREWITYAGAGFPLFVVDGATVEVIKGDRGGIGYRRVFRKTNLTNHEVRSGDGFRFYLTSDGLIDQLGGEKRRSFGKKRFKQLIAGLNDVPLSQHGEKIYEALLSYQGDEKRRDDVSVIGFKI